MARANLKVGNALQHSAAREKACADIRNAASFFVAQAYMAPKTKYYLNLNCDGTQDSSGGLVAFFIKYYLFISAAGVTAPPVYVIADDRMAEGDFEVYEVVGLGLTTEVAGKGYVVYCKTRCGNVGFYRWLI